MLKTEEFDYKKYINAIYFGLKKDIDNFLQQYEQKQSFDYSIFASLWQENHFTLIFSLYTQTGALYLLYGLYYKQPIKDFVKVRFTMNEYESLKTFLNKITEKKQYVPLFIYTKMKLDEAFVFVVYPQSRSLKTKNVEHLNENIFESNTSDSLINFKQFFKSDLVETLENTCKEYEKKLAEFAKNDPSLKPIKTDIMCDIKEAYNNIITERCEDNAEEPNEKEKIKRKAVKNMNAQYRADRGTITALDLL
ncbi:hypothetical protein ABEB36_015177 [Hypothenemus hampei]|uniref:Uncharacterized protein n=1 Tax=Hypothenemus hampei TaxID=57062 RepID=A0ABD1E2P6_HYPHA